MNNKQIGFFIKSLREEKEITQEKLSSIINVDRSVIAKIEAGKRMPTTEQLLILKKYFNVSTDELLIGRKNQEDENVDKSIFDEIDKKNKKFKCLKIIIVVLSLIVLIFLLVYFYNNYNKIKIYNISSESSLLEISDSIIVRTPRKIYFELNFASDIEIKKISVFYKKDNNEINIMERKSDKISHIYFYDFYYYSDYIDFKNLNFVLNNLYIRINDSDEIKLIIKLDESNDYFFVKKERPISIENNNNDNDDNYSSEVYMLAKKLTNNFIYNYENKVKILKNTYSISINVEDEIVTINSDDFIYNYVYSKNRVEIFYADDLLSKEIYECEITSEFNSCNTSDFYKFFISILKNV